MGLIERAIASSGAAGAIGEAAEGLSEVFVANATRRMELSAEAQRAALEAASAEFEHAGTGGFDRAINGLNRLPRPLLALGTIGLFVFAMVDPVGFTQRMRGLQAVPEPLWWLLGAIVSFYFGARELHYFRTGPGSGAQAAGRGLLRWFRRGEAAVDRAPADDPTATNPALSAWRNDAPAG